LPSLPLRIRLTKEEAYLWECARSWRDLASPRDPDGIDWGRLVTVGRANRMLPILAHVFPAAWLAERLPESARRTVAEDTAAIRENVDRQCQALRQYLCRAARTGLETVVYKGLSLSIDLYGAPALRPGGDIDILVRRDRVKDSVGILEEMGLGAYWPDLLDDPYYERHHLHQQRSSPDFKVWFEIHWALDHPYTRLTVDYEGLMDRTAPGELLGEPVNVLSPPDLLLALAVHLVKHAVYLPYVLARPDLARIILADGMLVYFLDVAEAIKRYDAAMDWDLAVELARSWGAVEILGSVLRVCAEFLASPVPEQVLERLPLDDGGWVTRRVMDRVADHEVAGYLGLPTSRFWAAMLGTEGAFIMRPIRLLDLGAYCFPGHAYLRRRYGDGSWRNGVRHLLRALREYSRIAVDGLYYAWKRSRRSRAEPTEAEP
jgi:hypothetical protein